MDPEQYRLSAGRHYRQLDRDAVPGQPSHGSLRVTMLAAPPTSPRTDPGAADPRRDERSPRRPDGGSQPLHDLLAAAAARRVMLVGRPGSGKTTALYQRAIALADDASAALPVVVALRELTGDYDDLERLILDCIGRCGVTPGPSLARLLAGQRFELLLDGLNERPAAVPATVFERLAHNYPDTAMIFSAREPMGALGATIYELRPLATTERNALVDAWLPGRAAELRTRLDRDAALDDLSRTPLLLTLLCETTRDGLPADSTRARLIAAFVANHARRYVERLGDPPHPRGRIDACLAGLATTMLAGPTPLQIADEPARAPRPPTRTSSCATCSPTTCSLAAPPITSNSFTRCSRSSTPRGTSPGSLLASPRRIRGSATSSTEPSGPSPSASSPRSATTRPAPVASSTPPPASLVRSPPASSAPCPHTCRTSCTRACLAPTTPRARASPSPPTPAATPSSMTCVGWASTRTLR